MPIIPVRGLSTGGVNLDAAPTSLPLNAWSYCRNIQFSDGLARRSATWKTVAGNLDPMLKWATAYTPSSGIQRILTVSSNGSLTVTIQGVTTNISEIGFVAFDPTTNVWTSSQSGDVMYLNNNAAVPRSFLPGAANFTALPAWPPTWTCCVMREFQSQMVALNMTVAGVALPTKVQISDIFYQGSTPATWDDTDETSLAYGNTLVDLDGPILDGLTLGDRFLIFTATEVWMMVNASTIDWQFNKLFSNTGIINTNCVVELNGLAYVFGTNDLYTTDANSVKSLAQGRIRKYLFRTIDRSSFNRCWVSYLPVTNELIFAYVSNDPRCAFSPSSGCNAAMLYNIGDDTWSILDLPNLTAMVGIALPQGIAWDQDISTWNDDDFDWNAMVTLTGTHNVGLSTSMAPEAAGAHSQLLAFDNQDIGLLPFPVASGAVAPAYLERTGIALDGQDAGSSPVMINKLLRSVYPIIEMTAEATAEVLIGGAMTPNQPVVWDAASWPFDPMTDDRVDVNSAAKYLAIKITLPTTCDVSLSGFDLDIKSQGKR